MSREGSEGTGGSKIKCSAGKDFITRLSSMDSLPKKVVVVVVCCCSFCCNCYYFKFSQNWVSNSIDEIYLLLFLFCCF